MLWAHFYQSLLFRRKVDGEIMGNTTNLKNEGKFFYGWWIVIGCTVIMAVLFAAIINTFSLYVLPVTTGLNIDRSEFTYLYSIMTFASMIGNPIFGMLVKKMKIRVMVTGSVLLAFLGELMLSQANGLGMIYLSGVILGIALSGGATIPVSVLITNWFEEKRGLCMGIAVAGSGVGGMILTPIVTWLLAAYGWRTAYLIVGIIILVCIVPFSAFVFRLHPEEKGLKPYGSDSIEGSRSEEKKPVSGLSYAETLKKPRFWLLCITIVLVAIVINAIVVNLVPLLTDMGAPGKAITASVSLAGMFIIIGKIVSGRVFDKLGITAGIILLMACTTVQFLFLYRPTSSMFCMLFIGFHGLGAPAANLLPAIVIGPLFGDRDYAAKYGITSLCAALGAALSSFVAGVLYNSSHGYVSLITFSLVLSVICFALFMMIIKTSPQMEAEEEPSAQSEVI